MQGWGEQRSAGASGAPVDHFGLRVSLRRGPVGFATVGSQLLDALVGRITVEAVVDK